VLLPIEGLLGLDALAGFLANLNFAGKAPPEVVAECQASLAEAQAQAQAELVRGRLGQLGCGGSG
jgi:valyl-tRNA synthetase